MNWVFETYSNVYSTAMMQNTKVLAQVAANKPSKARGTLARLFGRS
jgi:hypothetical protein